MQIVVWTLFTALTTLIKLAVLQLFRCHGHKALKWAGAVSQFSSCIGAIFVFILVNKTSFFIAVKPCQSHSDNYGVNVSEIWRINTTETP